MHSRELGLVLAQQLLDVDDLHYGCWEEDEQPTIRRLLKPGGKVVVCDFFKTEHHGDGQPGDKSSGGGHKLDRFYASLAEHRFAIEHDEDITRFISPSLALVDDMLRKRIAPACGSIDRYITARVPRLRRFIGWLLRKKLAKLRYKYLEENRAQAVFERYKSYRLLVLKPE